MKRIFAVALFLMLFASSALADGPGQIPPQSGVIQLADEGGIIPPAAATQPPLVSVAA